jgi:hypothetical protein
MTLQRLVLDFRTGELVVRCLYHTEGSAGPNTKARRREVTDLTREGLRRALAALEGRVDVVGSAGFETREDTLLVSASPAALGTTQQVKTKPKGA